MADRSEGVRRGAGRAVLAALLPRPYSAALPRGRSMEDPIQRPTPLLRWRGALLKLESLPPSGTVHALRTRWPKVRAIALTAADKELPELPREDEFPGAETRAISFSEASRARSDLARSAGVLGWRGQILTVMPGRGSCLRCLFEGPPPPGTVPTCAEAGVLAPLCGVVGAAMAAEAARLFRGEEPRWAGRLHQWDALHETERDVRVPARRDCPACRVALAPQDSLRHP